MHKKQTSVVSVIHHDWTCTCNAEGSDNAYRRAILPNGPRLHAPTERKKLERDGKTGDSFCTELGGREAAGDEQGFGQGEVGVGDYACCGGGCLKRFHAA